MMRRIGLLLVLFLSMVTITSCTGGNGGNKKVTILISPKDETILIGDELQYTATVTGLSDQRVSWSATGGEIDENGLYLATEPGTFDIIASSKADPSKTAKTKVHVVDVEVFTEVEAWQGYVTVKINDSWSSTDEAGQTYAHQYRDDIKREYRLEEEGYYWWQRLPTSPVEVSGSIHDRSDQLPKREDYCEVKWQGYLAVVPETSQLDYLSIDEETGTYTIVLYGFTVPEIEMVLYEDNEPVESWPGYGFEEIRIVDQPLPSVGKTLTGSKIEKVSLVPLLYATGAYDVKETNMTITWYFTPVDK